MATVGGVATQPLVPTSDVIYQLLWVNQNTQHLGFRTLYAALSMDTPLMPSDIPADLL